MIEIVLSNGDSAEAETPEEAVFAACTLLREAALTYYAKYTASFFVEGRLVRQDVSLQELTTGGAL